MIDESQAVEDALNEESLAETEQAYSEATCATVGATATPNNLVSTSPTTYNNAGCAGSWIVQANTFTAPPSNGLAYYAIEAMDWQTPPTDASTCERTKTYLSVYVDGVLYKSGSKAGVWNAPNAPAGCKLGLVSLTMPSRVAWTGKKVRAVATARSAANYTRKVRVAPYGL